MNIFVFWNNFWHPCVNHFPPLFHMLFWWIYQRNRQLLIYRNNFKCVISNILLKPIINPLLSAMIGHIQICVFLAIFSSGLGDYHSDFSDHSAVSNYNTYYPDYSYAYNYSNPSGYKRIFTEDYTLSKILIFIKELNTYCSFQLHLRRSHWM